MAVNQAGLQRPVVFGKKVAGCLNFRNDLSVQDSSPFRKQIPCPHVARPGLLQ